MPLLTAQEKEADMLKMTDAAASMDFWEEGKRATEVMSKAMKAACFLYDADARNI